MSSPKRKSRTILTNPVLSPFLMLWSSAAVTLGFGIVLFAAYDYSQGQLADFSNNDAFSVSLVPAVPCLAALVLYLLVRVFWSRAYLVYVVSIGTLLAVFSVLLLICRMYPYLYDGIGSDVYTLVITGIALVSPVTFFAKNMARSWWTLALATLVGIAYVGLYARAGFSL